MWNEDWVVNIKNTNFDLTPEVRAYLDERLDAISKLVVVQGSDTKVLCDIELEKALDKQHGNIWRAEMNLSIDGNHYRATARAENINAALDEMKDEITKQLRRSKKKNLDMLRRGGAKLKEMLRFGRFRK